MGKTKELSIPEEYVKLAKEEWEIDLFTSKVVIKRFVRGDISKIYNDCVKINASSISNKISADVKASDYKDLYVVRSVVDAPWKTQDLNALRELPPFLFDWLEKEVVSFNTIEVKKKED